LVLSYGNEKSLLPEAKLTEENGLDHLDELKGEKR